MKKLLTLLLTVCTLATFCALPVGAASFELDSLRCDNVLGEATINYTFDNEEDVFKESNKRPISYENGALSVSKEATDASESIDINADLNLTGLNLVTFRLKVDQKSGITTSVLFGSGRSKDSAAFWIDIDPGKLTAQDGANKIEKSMPGLTLNEYVEAKVLIDSASKKYYVWIGENIDIFNAEPIVDGFDFVPNNGTINTIRIWRASHKTEATLYLDSLMVTPLVKVPFMPVVGAEGYAYEETFPSTYGAYSEDAEPWKTFERTVLKERHATAKAAACNADDFEVTEAGELKITTNGYNSNNEPLVYHNWYFTKDDGYKDKGTNTDRLVIQVDIKSNATTAINLGSQSASTVPIRVLAKTDEFSVWSQGAETKLSGVSKTFVHEDVDTADYSTLTFLIETTNKKWSLWIDDKNIIERNDWNAKSNSIDSICFHAEDIGNITYVDNIRVFEAPEGFMNVWDFANSVTDISDFITTDANGIVSFGVSDDKDASNVSLSYADSKGYYNGNNIVFPLFADSADVRAVVSSGDYTKTYYSENAIAFPSGYTAIGSAIATGKTVSIPVTLRNSASARVDELIVIAAVYDKATKALIASNPCILKGNTFVAEFDKDVSGDNYEVRGFVWQKGTLRPVK